MKHTTKLLCHTLLLLFSMATTHKTETMNRLSKTQLEKLTQVCKAKVNTAHTINALSKIPMGLGGGFAGSVIGFGVGPAGYFALVTSIHYIKKDILPDSDSAERAMVRGAFVGGFAGSFLAGGPCGLAAWSTALCGTYIHTQSKKNDDKK